MDGSWRTRAPRCTSREVALVSDPTQGQPQWQQPQPPVNPGQQYPPPAYPQQPQAPYPPQMGYPQQPYGQPPVNVSQQGTSYTRAYIGPGFHFFHITLTVCTGGIWGIVYAIRYWQKRRPVSVTTHNR